VVPDIESRGEPRDKHEDVPHDGAPGPLPGPRPWPPDVAERLTDYLAELRFNADMSQRELSAAAGVPLATLARIESGARRDPRLSTLARLVAAAGYRLLICDVRNEPILPPPDEIAEIRDRAGRRLPAHLDAIPVNEWLRPWWKPKREYTFVRDRRRRDNIRARFDPAYQPRGGDAQKSPSAT
jgi:transcriptional regulator with XRE-family HTH domain